MKRPAEEEASASEGADVAGCFDGEAAGSADEEASASEGAADVVLEGSLFRR